MKALFGLLLTVLSITSCKLSQHYTFNSDFSGKYELKFDLSEIADYGNENGESENVFADLNVDSVKTAYEQIDGISHVEVKSEENVLHVKYRFKNLEALNSSLQTKSGDLNSAFGEGKFAFENGLFSYHFSDSLLYDSSDSIVEMMSIVDYDIVMEFKKTIDKASNGAINEDRKKLRMTGNLGEVATNKKSLNVEVTFK